MRTILGGEVERSRAPLFLPPLVPPRRRSVSRPTFLFARAPSFNAAPQRDHFFSQSHIHTRARSLISLVATSVTRARKRRHPRKKESLDDAPLQRTFRVPLRARSARNLRSRRVAPRSPGRTASTRLVSRRADLSFLNAEVDKHEEERHSSPLLLSSRARALNQTPSPNRADRPNHDPIARAMDPRHLVGSAG